MTIQQDYESSGHHFDIDEQATGVPNILRYTQNSPTNLFQLLICYLSSEGSFTPAGRCKD